MIRTETASTNGKKIAVDHLLIVMTVTESDERRKVKRTAMMAERVAERGAATQVRIAVVEIPAETERIGAETAVEIEKRMMEAGSAPTEAEAQTEERRAVVATTAEIAALTGAGVSRG